MVRKDLLVDAHNKAMEGKWDVELDINIDVYDTVKKLGPHELAGVKH